MDYQAMNGASSLCNLFDFRAALRRPFQFVHIYNIAALKNKQAPVFSADAIPQLKALEKRYRWRI